MKKTKKQLKKQLAELIEQLSREIELIDSLKTNYSILGNAIKNHNQKLRYLSFKVKETNDELKRGK